MENNRNDKAVQRFPNKNLGQDIERDQQPASHPSGNEERDESDANPLRNRKAPNEQGARQGNSSIPLDEEDTIGIP